MDAKHGSAESNVASNDNNTEIGMSSFLSKSYVFVRHFSKENADKLAQMGRRTAGWRRRKAKNDRIKMQIAIRPTKNAELYGQ